MRTLQLVLVLIVLIGGVWIAARATRAALEAKAGTPDGSATGRSTPSPNSTEKSAAVIDAEVHSVSVADSPLPATKPPTPLAPGERDAFTRQLANWQLENDTLVARLTPILDVGVSHLQQVATEDLDLAVRWRLKRAFLEVFQTRLRPPPETVSFLKLDNKRTLFAERVERTTTGYRIEIIGGGNATLAVSQVEALEELPAAEYLSRTAAEYARAMEQLDVRVVADVEHGLCRALARRDLARAESLFQNWYATHAPMTLAASLGPQTSRSLLAALERLGRSASAAPASTTLAVQVPKVQPALPLPANDDLIDPPESVEHLKSLLEKARKALGARPEGKARERLGRELMSYEDWVERSVEARALPRERLDALRRELQLLRLDLVKSAGF
ncbi:MAG: hypothetical protein ACKVX7_01910 [Planctomycetota bacterium]